ncbi:MAG TPA: hypothetical protein VGL35_07625 [Rhizomicrobium sp.]|jgi:hypothetical protein
MTGEKVDFGKAKATVGAGNDVAAKRQQSTIEFPNFDIEAAAEVAEKVYARRGLGSCPLDELAAELNVTMSGSFRLKNSAARMFGFIEKDGISAVKLTDLGARYLSAESEAEAKATAFLNISLYSQIYEKYRGKLLPPTKALEREMIALGVTTPQAEKARQIFQRSARQAGFFNSGEDRLVRPKITSAAPESAAETLEIETADAGSPAPREPDTYRRTGSGGGGGRFHPFIEGLLATLPEPGTLWTIEGRAAWLQAAAQNFMLIYKGDGKIDVTVIGKEIGPRQS